MSKVSSRAVAEWMLREFQEAGELFQQDAVCEIQELFGEAFTYMNENGNPAISREVLSIFRTLTERTAVWVRREQCWRQRADCDDPEKRVTDC